VQGCTWECALDELLGHTRGEAGNMSPRRPKGVKAVSRRQLSLLLASRWCTQETQPGSPLIVQGAAVYQGCKWVLLACA